MPQGFLVYIETKLTKKANKSGGGRYSVVKMPKILVNGSMFGKCTCGVPQTGTIPCQHMVALVQSGCIPALTQLTIMTVWCSMAVWIEQYPKDKEWQQH